MRGDESLLLLEGSITRAERAEKEKERQERKQHKKMGLGSSGTDVGRGGKESKWNKVRTKGSG